MVWLVSALTGVLLLAGSVMWSTFRTGISPMPSSRPARAAVLHALEATGGPVVELGSGWGHLVIATAMRYPERTVAGYELSWLPWLVSVLLKHALQLHNLSLYRMDFLPAIDRGELNGARVIVCYLHGASMTALASRLGRLQPPRGNLQWLISNTFALPGQQPEKQWQLRDFYRSPVYRYCLAAQPV